MKNVNIIESFLQAYENTPSEDLKKIFRNRVYKLGAGSFYLKDDGEPMTASEIEQMLLEAVEAGDISLSSDPAIQAPCVGYEVPMPGGRFGMVKLTDLPKDFRITFRDFKGIGDLSVAVDATELQNAGLLTKCPAEDTTIVITGDDGAGMQLFTLFPGGAIALVDQPCPYKDGDIATVADAISCGYEYAKIAA